MAAPIRINRAPVRTLWAAVVDEQPGFDRNEALSLGRAVAGLNAQSKGRRRGGARNGCRPPPRAGRCAGRRNSDIRLSASGWGGANAESGRSG